MPLRILIVDDVADTRSNIRRLLEFEQDFEVVGEAADGEDAVRRAKELVPDCILMDINMPGRDGISATESISVDVPQSAIVIMSVQGEQEYLRKAMLAGARDYLVKPFASDELVTTLRRVCDIEAERRKRRGVTVDPRKEPAKVVTVFSTKGGVGKTTVAANLAALLAHESGRRVALLDLDLQFGDVCIMFDIVPGQTLADLTREDEIDTDLIDQYLIRHDSGVRVMAAPIRPEEAELVRPAHIGQVIDSLKELADYVIVDTPQGFADTVLTCLDKTDQILFVVALDVPAVKNARLGMEVMRSLNYDDGQISIVCNRATEDYGVSARVVEENLGREIAVKIPSAPDLVVSGVNEGRPFVLDHEGADITRSVRELAELVGADGLGAKRSRGLLRFLQRA